MKSSEMFLYFDRSSRPLFDGLISEAKRQINAHFALASGGRSREREREQSGLMASGSYSEYAFRQTLNRALEKVKTVLENTKYPQHAADVPHTYNDKYLLAEFLTNTSIAAVLNVLETVGLSVEGVSKLVEWSKAQQRSVSLRLSAEERTTFVKETTREEEDPTSYVTERKGGLLGSAKITEKVVRKITEYFWKFSFEYEVSAFVGSDPNEKVVLFRRTGTA
jgi:hypothetical protein